MATTSATSSASLALSGLASGIDWTSIVSELLTVERAPEFQMNSQITASQQKNTAYQGIGTQLTALAKDVTTLSDPDFFDSRTTNVSNPAVATATAGAATPLGTYSFNVIKLATDAVQLGASASGKPLSDSSDVSSLVLSNAGFANPVSAGTFTINGHQITIATSDTLQSVFDKIKNVTGANGTDPANEVDAVYNPVNATTTANGTADTITLTSTNPIVLGSATDTSNFLQVAELFNNTSGSVTSASGLGGVNLTKQLSAANLSTTIDDGGAGAGKFLINGVAIAFNATKDSMKDVLQRINDSAAGVTATYDSVNDRFQLTSKTTGDVGISLQDDTGNFLAATGLSAGTLQHGDNLQYKINNGGTLTSLSNTIDGTSSGIAGLSITATGTNTTTIKVNSDTATISAAISSFVTDYNSAQSYISTQITPTPGTTAGTITAAPLTGDLDAEDIATQLRHLTTTPASGLSGVLKSLTNLGILSNGNNNTLSLTDTTALNNALANNLSGVKDLFTNSTTGLATTLNTYLTNVNGPNGSLASDENNMTKEVTNINASITALEARITQDGNRLTAEFVAMETAINKTNSQKQYLNDYFNGSGTSTNSAPQAASSSSSG